MNCCEIGNENGVVNRKLNNAFIGLSGSGTEYCINRAPKCLAKNRVSARKSANPKALFWCFATVLVKDYFEGDALVGVLTS